MMEFGMKFKHSFSREIKVFNLQNSGNTLHFDDFFFHFRQNLFFGKKCTFARLIDKSQVTLGKFASNLGSLSRARMSRHNKDKRYGDKALPLAH